MAHTKGPWHANGDCIEIDGPEGPRDVTLAVVLQPENAVDNARLIAAAPELLEACRHALHALNAVPRFRCGKFNSYDIASMLEHAISKAYGRSADHAVS